QRFTIPHPVHDELRHNIHNRWGVAFANAAKGTLGGHATIGTALFILVAGATVGAIHADALIKKQRAAKLPLCHRIAGPRGSTITEDSLGLLFQRVSTGRHNPAA